MNAAAGGAALPHARVVPADAADAGALSQVIADAFHDLAPSRWLITDPEARRAVFPGYFRIHVEDAFAHGQVDTTPDRAAVALWLPVSEQRRVPDPGYGARLAAATGPWASRFRVFDAALDRHHPAGARHHHLAMLAVRPGSQGQGTGSALLRAHHAILDQAALPAYLEASSLRSRRLYLAHGYRDHGSPVCLSSGVLMYPMMRQPGGQEPPSRT